MGREPLGYLRRLEPPTSRRLISRLAIVLYIRQPTLIRTGRLWLVRELLKKRRRTEVSVPYSGSGGAVGRHNNILKTDFMFVYADAISTCIPQARAACGARSRRIAGGGH
jgi:hypothetical protein